MSNRIVRVQLSDRSVIPTEAEVHVTVVPEVIDFQTDVRGRLVGPRCRYADTVEVAYPLRPWQVPTSQPAITLRAVVPEASLWDPESPHLYLGPVELWQNGQRVDSREIRHGLRHVSVGPRGLRVNGRLWRLRGRRVDTVDDATALQLRRAGYNLIIVPASDAARRAWEVADRVGLFVLGEESAAPSGERWRELVGHPSCLGWLRPATVSADVPANVLDGVRADPEGAPRASFVACPLAAFRDPIGGGPHRPVLLLDVPPDQAATLLDRHPSVIGVVDP
ncbi:MAG: hypothetical protein U0736_05095 [Gemmataceae bacterium]